MFARLARLLVYRPALVLSAIALLTVGAAVLAARIEFDFAPQSMLGGNAEMKAELEDFKKTFAFEDSVLIIVLEATGEQDVLAAPALSWQVAVAHDIDALDAVDRIDSIATMQTIQRGLPFAPRLESVRVIPEYPFEPEDASGADRVRRYVDGAPLLEDSLINRDRRITALMCFLSPKLTSLEQVRVAINEVRAILARLPAPAGYRVHVTGLPFVRVDTVDNLQVDQARLLPIAAVLYLTMLGIVFRRISGSLLPLLAVGIGLVWTIGGLVLMGETFNLISNILPILLLVIGVSNCVHIVADYGETTPREGGNRREAMRLVIGHMGYACLLSMLTTAIGFASLFNARSDVLVGFGWQCAWGMACLYFAIIGTLGSALQFFRPPRAVAAGAPLGGIVTRAADAVDRHPKATLLLATVFLGSMVWSARNVRVNASILETYEEGHPTLAALHLVEQELGGLLPLEVNLQATEPGTFLKPDIYRRVKELEAFAHEQESVLFARSYVDHHDAIEVGRPGDDVITPGDLPEDDASITARLKRSQRVLDQFSESMSYPSFMHHEGRRARVLIKAEDVGTRRLHVLINRLQAKLQELFPPGNGVAASMTGDAYVNTLAMENVISDLFTSLLTASIVIFSIIGIGFRSLRAGLIAAVPNMTPLLVTLGYMGLRGFEMNVSNVIVFTISLGIAVDDTIHFLARFRELVQQHDDVGLAVHHTYEETGRAIVIVTVLVVSGLSVLLFSDFLPTRRFAELTIVTMGTAVFGDLLLLPACLMLFWKRGGAKPPA